MASLNEWSIAVLPGNIATRVAELCNPRAYACRRPPLATIREAR